MHFKEFDMNIKTIVKNLNNMAYCYNPSKQITKGDIKPYM